MAYDPNWPPTNAELESAPFREQFQGLKALIDAQALQIATMQALITTLSAQVAALAATQVPIGGIISWCKDTTGVPALPPNFVECNGQILNDPESPLDGQFMPDINTGAQRFVRGGLNSGLTGGIDAFATALADNAGVGTAQNFVTIDFSPGAQPFPPYVTEVYIVRVK
jgi:hypothetical protein